jgi:hypothetical protein
VKLSEVIQGGIYTARVSGRIVAVRVERIRDVSAWNYSRCGPGRNVVAKHIDVVNLETGRRMTWRSAARLRAPILSPAER